MSNFELTTHKLAQDSIIEASAGAGKTFTIEHLVVRLLLEEGIELGKILLVTFTEKAAGEMKDRIREIIEKAISILNGDAQDTKDDPIYKIIRKALELNNRDRLLGLLQKAEESMDSASIHTIHGFCKKVLSQYGYEAGELGSLEMVDDKVVHETVLNQIMRKDWQSIYGDNLKEVITSLGMEKIKKILLEIASKVHDENFIIIPALKCENMTNIIQENTGIFNSLESNRIQCQKLLGISQIKLDLPQKTGHEVKLMSINKFNGETDEIKKKIRFTIQERSS